MPPYAQRSPSEALSPSVGPQWDRPTAISSDVWLSTQATPVDPAAPSPPPDGSGRTPTGARCRIGFPGEPQEDAREGWTEGADDGDQALPRL